MKPQSGIWIWIGLIWRQSLESVIGEPSRRWLHYQRSALFVGGHGLISCPKAALWITLLLNETHWVIHTAVNHYNRALWDIWHICDIWSEWPTKRQWQRHLENSFNEQSRDTDYISYTTQQYQYSLPSFNKERHVHGTPGCTHLSSWDVLNLRLML